MNILFTGSNGFVGQNIVDKFRDDGNLYSLGRAGSYINVDLVNSIPILSIKFDLVIHAAGVAHVISNSIKIDQYIYDSNIKATINLLKSLQNSHIPSNFIFLSSVAVYGLEKGILIDEANDLNGNTAYARSKIECEKIIINWCEKYNVNCTILRLPLIVGPNPKGNLASLIKSISLNIYFNISGNLAQKSMLHVNDVYNFIKLSYLKGGIYNLTDGVNPTVIDFTNQLALILGKRKLFILPYFIVKIVSKFGDIFGNGFFINTIKLNKLTSSLTFCNNKAVNTFDWNPISVIDNLHIDLIK